MKDIFVITMAILAGLGLILALLVISAIPLFFLWNWLMPIIFGVTKITFVQAIGVNVLAHILFGSKGNGKSKNEE